MPHESNIVKSHLFCEEIAMALMGTIVLSSMQSDFQMALLQSCMFD